MGEVESAMVQLMAHLIAVSNHRADLIKQIDQMKQSNLRGVVGGKEFIEYLEQQVERQDRTTTESKGVRVGGGVRVNGRDVILEIDILTEAVRFLLNGNPNAIRDLCDHFRLDEIDLNQEADQNRRKILQRILGEPDREL